MRNSALSLLCLVLVVSAPNSGNAQPANVSATPSVTQHERMEGAWARLETSIQGTRRTDTRLLAISAIAVLGGNPRADKLAISTLHDTDIDVRLAGIVAAGEMAKAAGPGSDLPARLRDLLNDTDPAIAFTAANALWKLGDVSGEDILVAVADGERSATDGLWKSTRHNASRDLHSPATLAKIGAMQGITMLVPPVGIGMGAYGYLHGSNGSNPRVTAVTELARERSTPVRDVLIGAAHDKDTGVRLAAAEALANYRGPEVTHALESLLDDSKENVRLMASAAYLRVLTAGPTSPTKTHGAAHRASH